MRMALEFQKSGAAKYISHLDLQRAFSRAIRRSGLPVALSKGFNPHFIVSFASALALGIESECECAEIALECGVSPDEFFEAMKRALPPGLEAKRAAVIRDGAPKLAASVREAEYAAYYKAEYPDRIKSAVCDIMDADAVRISKGGKETDIKSMIFSLAFEGDVLIMRLAAAPSGSLRPDVLAGEIKKRAGDYPCRIVRTKLLAYENGRKELLDAYKA